MNRINPYRRNCEIMRKFFAKPIFLIIGIVLLVYLTANTALCFLSKQVPVFDFMSTAICIASFMFYFKAHSRKEYVSFKAPTILMDVVSIVGIVFSGLIFVFSGFMTVLFMLPAKPVDMEYHGSYEFLWSTLGKAVHELAIIFFPIVAVLSLLFLLYFIGMQRMTLSFKKSLSNIYLQRKGAVIFGMTSIILAVVSVICYMGMMTIPFTGIEEFIASLLRGINIPSLVQGLLITLIFVLYAILGFMYNLYIKKLANTLETGRPVQTVDYKAEEITENNPTLNIWTESDADSQAHKQATVTRPVEFTPQTVFGEKKSDEVITTPTAYKPPKNDMQNPYIKNGAPPTKRCANCGKENPSINIFCGNCGNRL